MQEELEDTHRLFKEFVKSQRPSLDIDKVATGEHWLGTKALELGLVDILQTSDDYLMMNRQETDLIQIEYSEKRPLVERLSNLISTGIFKQHKDIQDFDKPLLM